MVREMEEEVMLAREKEGGEGVFFFFFFFSPGFSLFYFIFFFGLSLVFREIRFATVRLWARPAPRPRRAHTAGKAAYTERGRKKKKKEAFVSCFLFFCAQEKRRRRRKKKTFNPPRPGAPTTRPRPARPARATR